MGKVDWLRRFAWSGIGVLSVGLAQWAIVVAIARLTSPEIVGIYGASLAIANPIFAMADLQLRGLQSTDATEEFSFSQYLVLRAIASTLGLLLVVGLASWGFLESISYPVTLGIGLSLTVRGVSDVFCGYFQQHERQDKMAQSRILGSLAILLGFTISIRLSGDLSLAVLSGAAAGALMVLLYDFPMYRRLALDSQTRATPCNAPQTHRPLTTLVKLAAPLGFISLLLMLQQSIPRLFLTGMVGVQAVGVFVALSTVVISITSTTALVTQVIAPRLARYYASRSKHRFTRILIACELLSLVGGLIFVGGSVLLGPEIVAYLYSPEYAKFHAGIVWLSVGVGIGIANTFIGNALTVGRVLAPQVGTVLLSLFILIVLSLVLIPAYGVTGACASVTIAGLSHFVGNVVICIRFLNRW